MSEDETFEPKLGKTRGKDGKRTARYLSRIVVAARLAGVKTGVSRRRFDGSRIGRGASIGRLLSSRDRFAGLRARRAVVKIRLVRLGPKGLGTAHAHLRYIQRDGVTREGEPGQLYSRDADQADGKDFLERSANDRHQFRVIVSAEDGDEYPDLKPYVRRLMAQVEQDLGTDLDWVAVDHFNTGRPHTHIMLRGVDDQGQNLIIAREYIAHGFRERATEIVSRDLGPRTDLEIEDRLRHDAGEERLTAIDRRLLRRMDANRSVAATDRDPFQQAIETRRLRKLAVMELADNLGAGRYRLADGLEETLRRMGERGDIIRLMQREIAQRLLDRPGVDQVIAHEESAPVVGRVLLRGLSDEYHDRHYLLIDGTDGRVHYVDIGKGEFIEPLPDGAIVRAEAKAEVIRDVDRTVAAIAAVHGGHYSVDLHLKHDAGASQAFVETHIRRLEAMRRGGVDVERAPDGTWRIAEDHLDQAAVYEARLRRNRPVAVEILSTQPLERLPDADAATWLDRELVSPDPTPLRNLGFGREVRDAISLRQQWLVEQDLAESGEKGIQLRSDSLAVLAQREFLRVAGQLVDELSLPFAELHAGDAIEGRLTRRVDLASGRFALVERAHDFVLVPWRPVLDRQLGDKVAGIQRADGVNWRFGRQRAGPEIS